MANEEFELPELPEQYDIQQTDAVEPMIAVVVPGRASNEMPSSTGCSAPG